MMWCPECGGALGLDGTCSKFGCVVEDAAETKPPIKIQNISVEPTTGQLLRELYFAAYEASLFLRTSADTERWSGTIERNFWGISEKQANDKLVASIRKVEKRVKP